MSNEYKLKLCKDFAIKNHNGLCLSTEYINSKTKMLWQCEKGHQWLAVWSHVNYSESWCPDCSGNKKYTIEEVKEFIESIGYTLMYIWEQDYRKNKKQIIENCIYFLKNNE